LCGFRWCADVIGPPVMLSAAASRRDGMLIITGHETPSLLESIPSRLGSSRRADSTTAPTGVHHAVHGCNTALRAICSGRLHPNVVRQQGEIRRTLVDNASDFTGRTTGSSRVPSHPHRAPIVACDVHKRSVCSLGRPLASPPVLARPARPRVGRREGGGNPAAVRPEFRTHVAGNLWARVGGGT